MRRCLGTYNLSESALGGAALNIETSSMVGGNRAAGKSDGKKSGYFD